MGEEEPGGGVGGRALLLGMLLFCGLVMVILAAYAGKWLSSHSS